MTDEIKTKLELVFDVIWDLACQANFWDFRSLFVMDELEIKKMTLNEFVKIEQSLAVSKE
jgi:hypothetical protein